MIYLFSLIVIILVGIIFDANKNDKSKRKYIMFSFGIMTIISALRKYSIGIDLNIIYTPLFKTISMLPFNSLKNIQMEYGFVLFCKLISMISTNIQAFIVVTSVLIYTAYGNFIYKNSKNVVISTSLFLLLNLYFMSMNIIRQQLSVAIILYGYEFLKKDKKILFILFVVIASLFHQSAIICVLFLLFDKKKIDKKIIFYLFIIIIISLVFYKPLVEGFNNIISFLGLNSNKNYIEYLTNIKYGKSIFNLDTLSSYILSSSIFILGYYYIVILNNQNRNSNLYVLLTACYMICDIVSSRMIIINRLEFYFLPFALLLIPDAISYSKIKNNSKAILIVLYSAIILKYGYILINLSGQLYGISPYVFFWQ